MLRSATVLLIVYSILTISLAMPAIGQISVPANGTSIVRDKEKPDLIRVIAENNRQYLAKAGTPNVRELEKLNRQQPQKKGLTGKQKTWIVLGAIGLAALIFVLVKYGKDCVRSEPAGCTPTVDEPCTCLEYEKK